MLFRSRLIAQGVEYVLGWVDDMPGLMHACDVMIQNAGGMTVYEARACGLPVVTYRTLPGHGQTNAEALDEAGTAPWVRDAADLRAALDKALLETSWDEVPEFAADPVAVILGMAPRQESRGAARVPRQRDRRNRRWERRLRGVRFGPAAARGDERDELDEYDYGTREAA